MEKQHSNFYLTAKKIWDSVVKTDRMDSNKQKGIPCFSIIGLDGMPSYYNIQNSGGFRKSYDLLTKREREILKLIIEGKK